MENTRDRLAKVGLALAGSFFRIALWVCVAMLIFWVGKSTYHFGYDIFNQQPMSPGDGQEVTVVIQEGASAYEVGKILEQKGLVEDAKVFFVQELLSNYHGEMQPGTYLLSTAYTPTRMMGIMAGDSEQEGASAS